MQKAKIVPSNFTLALINELNNIKPRILPPDLARISVSQTVSFFAILYEKVRNAVEFREEHLIRRAAIDRILKRRFMLNSSGKNEAENLIRELLWARYIPNNSLAEQDLARIQKIIDLYGVLRGYTLQGRSTDEKTKFAQFLFDIMTCEIEEDLSPDITKRKNAELHFLFQVLKNKIEIKKMDQIEKDRLVYVASEIAFAKSDLPYIKYHLFKLLNKQVGLMNNDEIEKVASSFPEIYDLINKAIKNPIKDKLTLFIKKQVPPFLILFTIFRKFPNDINKIISTTDALWSKVDTVCREKYQETGKKLRTAAIRSIIYIFLTKMVFVLALEYPVSKYIYNSVEIIPLTINLLFPPLIMAIIVTFVSVPSDKNTRNIFNRIVDILNRDPSFETTKTLITSSEKTKRPILVFGFTLFYFITFGLTFYLIYLALDYLGFTVVSKLIFIFFICVVTFFGYRIRQTSKEYSLEDKQGILTPLVDLFFIPILSVGKFLSSEIAKINIFILIFDFFIEAPFKLIFEIVEEWTRFVKQRKEEII